MLKMSAYGYYVSECPLHGASPPSGRGPVARSVLEAAVALLPVGVPQVGIVLAGDRLAASCAWLAGDERGEQLPAERLVLAAVAAAGGRGAGLAGGGGGGLASGASHCPGEVTVEEALAVQAESLGHWLERVRVLVIVVALGGVALGEVRSERFSWRQFPSLDWRYPV
jgi:hypothetical protein